MKKKHKKKLIYICPGKRTSLKETSRDSHDDSHDDDYMTDAEVAVVNFDKLKTNYMNEHHHSEEDAKSVDALARGVDYMLYMIEFKNGKNLDSTDIRIKIKDSLLILCDLCNRRLADTRKEIIFVLVVNMSKIELSPLHRRAIIGANKSGHASAFCGLDKIAGIFVKKLLIYDREELDTKLLPKLTDI